MDKTEDDKKRQNEVQVDSKTTLSSSGELEDDIVALPWLTEKAQLSCESRRC